jgi:hypothetical protein
MRRSGLWLAVLALVVGVGAAVASAQGTNPLPPKALGIVCVECGAAVCCDEQWLPLTSDGAPRGLWLTRPTFLRGPARILVEGGTLVIVPAGHVVRALWDPAVRGWRFEAWCGDATVAFTNTCYPLCEGRVVTLITAGDVYRGVVEDPDETRRIIIISGGQIRIAGAGETN